MAVQATKNKRIGVIGTEGTIHSHIYRSCIQQIDPEISIFGKPCPLLFRWWKREHWPKDPVTETVARRYLAELQKKEIDTLILGCTHYPLLRGLIGEVMGDQVTLVNPAYETAQALKRLLKERIWPATGQRRKNFPIAFLSAMRRISFAFCHVHSSLRCENDAADRY